MSKESALGLLISFINENTKLSADEQKNAFLQFVFQDGNESFAKAIVREWMQIKYSTAIRAAKPLSIRERLNAAKAAVARRDEERKEVEATKAKITARLLDLVTPNGKPLRECTGADCIKIGGFYRAIGKAIGPRQRVGRTLTPEKLQSLLEGNIG